MQCIGGIIGDQQGHAGGNGIGSCTQHAAVQQHHLGAAIIGNGVQIGAHIAVIAKPDRGIGTHKYRLNGLIAPRFGSIGGLIAENFAVAGVHPT